MLDIGCGEFKYENSLGMDKRCVSGVDVVADAESFPYPFKDKSFDIIIMSHLFEHIKPWLSINVMDECWRVLRNGGGMILSVPYGVSDRYIQDPTHCNPCNELTFSYFDPKHGSKLWNVYKPKPWEIFKIDRQLDLIVTLKKEGRN